MIAGPNGAGKTTSAMALMPNILNCQEYVNADTIAAALSPFNPDSVAINAGRVMLERIHLLTGQKVDFAFETTGASKSFAPFLANCKQQGYHIVILYLQLQTPELAVERVALRVASGGHNIPTPVVHRRYHRSLDNFSSLYAPLADEYFIYDNSNLRPMLIEQKAGDSKSTLDKIDYGVRLGATQALSEHKKAGRSIAVWKDGKVVQVPPQEIRIDEMLHALAGKTISKEKHD